jgi:hypothetical protein
MKNTKSAVKNVLTKLSAMRVTLSNEEQAVLDRIVLTKVSSIDEVTGHAMQTKAANTRAANMKASVGKLASGAAPDDDEVTGHAMQTKAASTKAASSKLATSVVIAFNPETGQYIEK